jgi:hypothetical protein
MLAIEIIGIIIGTVFVINLIVTAVGDTKPGKARRILNGVAAFGIKVFLIYLAVMLIYTVFSGLSLDRSVRSVLGNIFAVVLAVLLAGVFLSDFFPNKDTT